jgi:hypothetical protein
MSRVPFDIQFLLESILSEDPDRVYLTKNSVAKLRKDGSDVFEDTLDWDTTPDAIPFYIDQEENVVIFCKMNTHGRMERALSHAANVSIDNIMYERDCVEKTYMNCHGIYVKSGIDVAVYFYGLPKSNMEGIKEYLKENRTRLKRLKIRGTGDESEAIELCGRMWYQHSAISFWNEKANVSGLFNLVFSFMKQCGMNPSKCAYEFIDSKQMFSYKELRGNVDDKEKLSPEEIKALQSKQHLDPKAKAKLFGPEYKQKHKEKAAKRFDYPAKADASMPALEGRIKLKDLIKESPDVIISVDGKTNLAHYTSGDAIAFFAYPNFSALNPGGVHTDIMQEFQTVYDNLDQINSDPSEKKYYANRIYKHGVIISNVDDMFDALSSGPLHDYIKSETWRSDDEDPGAFRVKSSGLGGRLWKNRKLISFWNSKEDVLKDWSYVEKMFRDNQFEIGNLEDYNVDWIERDVRGGGELTPASSISSYRSEKKDDPSQLSFLDKLADEKPISKEEIKKIQQRLHTMSAQEKKSALMKLGATNTKAADIADKLGMTVAEFNHIMNVNEGEE